MSLKETIETEYKNALKSKDKIKISTYRLILSSIKDLDILNRSGPNKKDTDDEDIKKLLKKMMKQRTESIDIYKKGDDKSQTFEHIKNKHTESEFIFIGDGIENKGNDYSLAKLMDGIKNCKWYQTSGYQQTQEILEKLNGKTS